MAGIFESIRKGMKSMSTSKEPKRYEVKGKEVVCPHCSDIRFYSGSAQLNTAGMSLMNLDWANKSAATLTCSHCGYILWFMFDVCEI